MPAYGLRSAARLSWPAGWATCTAVCTAGCGAGPGGRQEGLSTQEMQRLSPKELSLGGQVHGQVLGRV